MSHGVMRAALALALTALLPSCYGVRAQSERVVGAGALALDVFPESRSDELVLGERAALTIGQPVADRAGVLLRGFHEPGDWAHRNYCGAGATQVLLSAWLPAVPDIETVARRAHLNPAVGQTGADTVVAINSFLDPVVGTALEGSWYQGGHITSRADVQARIRGSLTSPEANRLFGHGAPVMVQVMTRTLPGWGGWNATHMITIYGFDFSRGDPAVDRVMYAETPSPLAGYRGPDFQSVSVQALWAAMQAFLTESPSDPINIIS